MVYKDRSKSPETVGKVVSRQRTYEFKQKLKAYAQKLREQEQSKSFSAKTGRRIVKGLSLLQRGAITRALYKQPVAPFGSNLSNLETVRRTGRRGRPRGTYDQRYAKFGGVYGYRKWLSQQRFKERQEILQRSAVNPRQLAVLRQIQARDNVARMSPERRTIPDTFGSIPMANLFDEINDASNIIP